MATVVASYSRQKDTYQPAAAYTSTFPGSILTLARCVCTDGAFHYYLTDLAFGRSIAIVKVDPMTGAVCETWPSGLASAGDRVHGAAINRVSDGLDMYVLYLISGVMKIALLHQPFNSTNGRWEQKDLAWATGLNLRSEDLELQGPFLHVIRGKDPIFSLVCFHDVYDLQTKQVTQFETPLSPLSLYYRWLGCYDGAFWHHLGSGTTFSGGNEIWDMHEGFSRITSPFHHASRQVNLGAARPANSQDSMMFDKAFIWTFTSTRT
jgi:hypothetical protein